MLALNYHGSNDVRVDNVPDPVLQDPDDIILKITDICVLTTILGAVDFGYRVILARDALCRSVVRKTPPMTRS